MHTHVDYGPDTAEEQELKRLIAELQQRYFDAAQPLFDRLAKIHALKIPRILMVQDLPGKAVM